MVTSDQLEAVWAGPPGLRGRLTAVNHKQIGLRFVLTALVFLLSGGLLALLMRLQLAVPDNEFLDPDTYNELFTVHGTTMMFLFAVPIVEGIAMYVIPLLIGTRDLPFPRLNALGYWCYLLGGLFVYSSFAFGTAPDGGWFAYVPLTGSRFSPDAGLDFWLLGVTLVEVSGIIGAVELIVAILKQRAPGMSLGRMPLFVWSILATAVSMLLAFTPLVAGSILLEIDRKLGFRVYDTTAGGDPLLWQHLFWWFGHPEVYIAFIPAAGIVSMVVPVFSRRPIVGYAWIAGSLVTIAFLSFHLWVHHMFTVGIPLAGMAFFAAASFLIAIPSGIQMFAWIGTMWLGRPRIRTPLLFVLGFLVLFVMGGVTGVMVASIPFDRQVHDTFFVVAHFHYVLVGGVVFPVFAGLQHWFPKATGRMPSERGGKTAFWLMFIGFNLTFLVQHYLGLIGMPRRVFTYPAGLGWEWGNLVSTMGSLLLGIGIVAFLANLVIAWRKGPLAGPDPWDGATLEWATDSPPATYDFARIPVVAGRDPLWEPPPEGRHVEQAEEVDRMGPPARRVMRTSGGQGEPEVSAELSGPSWMPLIAAAGLVVGLTALLVDFVVVAVGGGIVTMATVLVWAWRSGASEGWTPLPGAAPGRSAGWWAAFLSVVATGTIAFSFPVSFVYLWARADAWPPDGVAAPPVGLPLLAAGLLVAGAAAAWIAAEGPAPLRHPGLGAGWLLGAIATVTWAVHLATADIAPAAHAFASLVALITVSALVLAATATVTGALVQARLLAGARPGWAHDAQTANRLIWVLAAGFAVTVPLTVHLPGIVGG